MSMLLSFELDLYLSHIQHMVYKNKYDQAKMSRQSNSYNLDFWRTNFRSTTEETLEYTISPYTPLFCFRENHASS